MAKGSTNEPWVVYNANGDEAVQGDRAYGPYDRCQAEKVAAYMNMFSQEWGRAWTLRLRPASEGPS